MFATTLQTAFSMAGKQGFARPKFERVFGTGDLIVRQPSLASPVAGSPDDQRMILRRLGAEGSGTWGEGSAKDAEKGEPERGSGEDHLEEQCVLLNHKLEAATYQTPGFVNGLNVEASRTLVTTPISPFLKRLRESRVSKILFIQADAVYGVGEHKTI